MNGEQVKKEGRRILFEGIVNCRDLGGLMTSDGRKVREGFLFRSANLQYATDRDLMELKECCGITEVVDLRNREEQSEHPDRTAPGILHVDMPIITEQMMGVTHEENLPPYEIWPQMGDLYIKFVTEEPLRNNIAGAVRHIMTRDFSTGGVLWHCYGGKDRCGLTAAFILSVLGVPYSAIKEDYMMTNITAAETAERLYNAVLERGGSQKEADFEYDANIARESYIDNAFAAVNEQYGGPVSFLKENGGVTEEEIENFRNKLIGYTL
ncbi:MAG: tyrosine-protein phosphatase [Blautia sp.]|nr:tyrosine-protein phosphatase [Blautia sp.]